MNADVPVERPEDDRFGYLPFAKQLAPSLILKPGRPSLVAGIEAPWGAGKTSFLNLLRLELKQQQPEPLVLNYYPWLYSTIDSLLVGFCTQLASQLGTSNSPRFAQFGAALATLGDALSPLAGLVPGYGVVATTGVGLIGRMIAAVSRHKIIDIHNARARVQTAIDRFAQPIVIFVDDVDRLAPEEIRLLFQFLKAVAAFEGVSYAVAYDTKPVERALTFGQGLSGREYLKKFIQLPIRLPRISNLLLQQYLVQAVEWLRTETQPPFTHDEAGAMESAASSAELLVCLRTPRDIVRLLNVFRMRLSDCRRELSLDELLIYVALELTCPEAIELVRDHPSLFVSQLRQHEEFAARETRSRADAILELEEDAQERKKRLYNQLPADTRDVASTLLARLFGRRTGVSILDVRRASSPHGLIKLLYGGGSPLSFSLPEVVAFLEDIGREHIISAKATGGVLRQWLIFASALPDPPTVRNPLGLAAAVITATTPVKDADRLYNINRRAADYLSDLLGAVATTDRSGYLTAIVEQQTNLLISAEVLLNLSRDAGLWSEGQSFPLDKSAVTSEWKNYIPIESLPGLQQSWIRQVRLVAKSDRLRFHPQQDVILIRWGQFAGNDYLEPQVYVREFCEKYDPLELLRQFSLGLSLGGLRELFPEPVKVKQRLSAYKGDDELRDLAIRALTQVETMISRGGAPAPNHTYG